MRKKSVFYSTLILIIVFQLILIIYLITNKNKYESNIFLNTYQFNRYDTLNIIKEILNQEKKRIEWDSTKPLEIIKYPFIDLRTEYSEYFKQQFVYFTYNINFSLKKNRLNILTFNITKDSIANIQYRMGDLYQGAIWLKKKGIWKTTRFIYTE